MSVVEGPTLSILRTPDWCITNELRRYFSDFFSPSNTERILNWSLFHNFIQLYFMELLDRENLWKFCLFSISAFKKHDCPNSFLVLGILEIRHRHVTTNWLLTSDIYTILHSMKRPQSIVWKCSYGRHLNCSKSMDAVYAGDLLQLQVLMKYGFTYESPKNFPVELKQAKKIVEKYYQVFHDFDSQECYQRRGLAEVNAEAFLEFYSYLDDTSKERMSFGRLLFVLMFVEAVSRKVLGEDSQNYKRCLELYCHAVPDALVSLQEFRKFLGMSLGHSDNKNGHFKVYFCSLFAELFPWLTGRSQPRSLKHLCRCKVRESLSDSVLPFAVDQIMPNDFRAAHLRQYLLCEL